MAIASGTRLGRYEIRSQIGAGGMGEVYLAQDTKLERTVALKILPNDVASDQKRMHRFTQEARAASALNHPNIITIYEVEQVGSTHFIATEFIDGETLRQHMARARLTIQEALDVGVQAASALATAHEAGIVHRDIKPDNIMLRRRDQIVKVLDFGLAKLTERQSSTIDTEAATRALVNTAPGMVMGTASYMSPEQARGLDVDARTDIWSLGATLYEMVAGRVPFGGETATDAIASILKTDPQPLSRFAPEVPAKLEEIIFKALEKDREERYQTVKDMLVDIRRLKKRLDFESELERSHPPDSSDAVKAASGAHATTITDDKFVADTRSVSEPRPTTSAEYLVTEIKRHRKGLALASAALIVAAAALFFIWYKFGGQNRAAAPDRKMKITRLISGLSGRPGNVSISPDGRYVAYGLYEGGKVSLWVRQISQDTSLQILPPAEESWFDGTSFSPDGELIYFTGYNAKTNTLGSFYQVPVLGGRAPKKILDHVNSAVSISPDGKQFAFVRYFQSKEEYVLMVAGIDGGEPRRLASRANGFDWFSNVTWSPDGKKLGYIALTTQGGYSSTIMEIAVEGGPEKTVTAHKWAGANRLNWLRDGSGLILLGSERLGAPAQLWHISYPDGAVRGVTNDLNEYGSLGLTANGDTIVTILREWSSKIWMTAPNEDESRAKKLGSGREDGRFGVALMPDGRVVYTAKTGENQDIWIMNADGTAARALTSDAFADFWPTVSPDGRYILFHSYRADNVSHIWRMDADGGNLKQLTTSEDYSPACSPDGRWVVFQSFRNVKATLWKVSIDGGEAVQVSDRVAYGSVFSPDGKLLSCMVFDESASPPRVRPALISFEDGQLVKFLDFPTTAYRPKWSPSGRDFLYTDSRADVYNIWSQSVAGGKPVQLTKFTSDFIDEFDISRNGKYLVVNRRNGTNDIVLIRDFR